MAFWTGDAVLDRGLGAWTGILGLAFGFGVFDWDLGCLDRNLEVLELMMDV